MFLRRRSPSSGSKKPSLRTLSLITLTIAKLAKNATQGARKRFSHSKARCPNSSGRSEDLPHHDSDCHGADIPEAVSCDDNNAPATWQTERPLNRHFSASLPPELWAEIMKHATNTLPPPMSIHDFAHAGCIDFPRLTCLELQRRLHHLSMRTKTALTLVCKSWYPLAKRILFGSVRISDQKQVEILLHLLSSELKEGKVGSASSAWWIKELWFDTTICTCSLPAGSNALAQLLLLCPRLLAFRKFGRSDCGADDIQEINTVLGPLVCGAERSALRNLDLAFSNSWSFEYFLAAHPALQNELPGIRYMELRPSYISLFESPEAEGSELRKIRPTFPSLTSLRLLGSLCVIQAARFNLPYIRSLALYSTTFDRVEDYYHIPTVLQAHGSNLVELELDLPLESLPNLQNACPKLQRLQVPATVLLDAQLPSISHSGVHTLGLFGMQKLVYEQKHHVFTSSLTEALGKYLSGVKVVQDVSLKSHDLRQRSVAMWTAQDALDHRSFWSSLVSLLGARGVKLTDWSGCTIAGFESRRDSMVMDSEADVISEGLMCCT